MWLREEEAAVAAASAATIVADADAGPNAMSMACNADVARLMSSRA